MFDESAKLEDTVDVTEYIFCSKMLDVKELVDMRELYIYVHYDYYWRRCCTERERNE